MGIVCGGKTINNTGEAYYLLTVHQWKEKEKKYTLFDYTTTESTTQHLNIDRDIKICKVGENIIAILPNQVVKGAIELLSIENNIIKPIADVWSIVRSVPVMGIPVMERVRVLEGAAIRLGRVQIVLQDVCFAYAVPTEESESEEDCKSELQQDSPYACRICMSKLGTLNNPFVSPCICSGSVKFTHVRCLSQWISSKIKTKELNNIILYYWSTLQCEICKESYKLDFQYQGRRYCLLDIPKPKEAYLVFSISHIDKNKEKGLYVVNMNGRDAIRVGRIQDNDIKLQDISVSRLHATIYMNKEDKTIHIEDHQSKFGTLVKCRDTPIENKKVIQVMNSVVVVDVMRKGKNFRSYDLPMEYQVQEQENNPIEESDKPGQEDDIMVNYHQDEQFVTENYLSGDHQQQ